MEYNLYAIKKITCEPTEMYFIKDKVSHVDYLFPPEQFKKQLQLFGSRKEEFEIKKVEMISVEIREKKEWLPD